MSIIEGNLRCFYNQLIKTREEDLASLIGLTKEEANTGCCTRKCERCGKKLLFQAYIGSVKQILHAFLSNTDRPSSCNGDKYA